MPEPKCSNCKFYKHRNCTKFSSQFYMMIVDKNNNCGKFEPKEVKNEEKKKEEK